MSLVRGFKKLSLYADDAVGFYDRLGVVIDRTLWKGFDTALTVRAL